MWSVWWVWIAGGFALGVLEVLLPGFIFLGFAIGAVLTGLLLALGFSIGLPPLLLIFALLSLAAWLGLRAKFGSNKGQVKLWHTDINE
jgi:membrane protein implicated in regulation of membrane protease activity